MLDLLNTLERKATAALTSSGAGDGTIAPCFSDYNILTTNNMQRKHLKRPTRMLSKSLSVILALSSCLFLNVNAFTTPLSRHRPELSRRFLQPTDQPPQQQQLPSIKLTDGGIRDPEPSPPFSVTLEGSDYSYGDAMQRTLGWVGAAIVFGGVVWATTGATTGEEFFAGYLVEQSLSVDNLFVFLLLFDYFKVPLAYQDRVLNWGIYGAILFRAIMIGLGAALLKKFHAILLVFAGVLVYSAANVFLGADDDEEDPSNNQIVKLSKSLFKTSDHYDEDRFFTFVDGKRLATPLFICMIAIEISDIVFAVDSIPAVFGVTSNPLVIFSSNIFAIMGLRSLYTILSKAATDLVYLEPAVALVLGFIGGKMILEYFGYCIPTSIALSVVGTLLGVGVFASVREKERLLALGDNVGVSDDQDNR